MMSFIFGKLTLSAFEQSPTILAAVSFMGLVGLVVIILLTKHKRWGWLWREWLTTLDHKKIGMMYLVIALIMFFRGGVEALLMRGQQSISVGASTGFLSANHFDQLFSSHGVDMIFFVAMPLIFALFNLIIPLQIGSRDVAFPFLNAMSFWFFAAGAMVFNMSLILGHFAATGWVAYPPLSELAYSPGVGVDYWIWALQLAGVGTLLAGINFLVTIIKMRCPGMTLMKMPLFIWTALATNVMVVFAFPILTATLGLLFLDRFFGMHFFTAGFGGNAMMYVNLFWSWGHPEVYILIMPIFGIFSEVVATFSKKRLFGYASMVYATAAITLLSFTVWLHHFFTMGGGADLNAFFGIATMLIAVPTGVKIFNWIFTMYQGRVRFTLPMYWFFGFIATFTLGGVAGVMMAIPGIDYELHNSLFLVAHFHTMLIGGVMFGLFSGLYYWFPKYTGFKLSEAVGKWSFWCWLIGFFLAFGPLYILGFMGATRRLYHYSASTGWQPLFIVAGIGSLIIAAGFILQIAQMFISYRDRKKNIDLTGGDPWDARTLEWSIPSPVPEYNFAIIPEVHDRDPFWDAKQKGVMATAGRAYEDISMPKNTSIPILMGGLAFVFGFAIVWHIIWLVVAALLGGVTLLAWRLSSVDTERVIPASEVERMDSELRQKIAA
ncbi:MAG: cbb3-type cytochrome c oxidase subunit I [Patescibacteria group bacterium]|nr:cbb3-type cytochrome c oxidase subunit I [Patescibacteria group bacterium]